MAFLEFLEKVLTKPVYLFGENKEKTDEQEEEELFEKNEKGEIKWYDRIFSWPIFLITWLADIAINFFWRQPNVRLGQHIKPRKLKTAATPLLQFFTFLIRLVVIMALLASLFIGVLVLIGWIFTNYSKF